MESLLWRKLRPQLRELGDWDVVKELVKNPIGRGNSVTGNARYTAPEWPARRRRLARGGRDPRAHRVVRSKLWPLYGGTAFEPVMKQSGPATARVRSTRTWSDSSAEPVSTS